MGFALFILALAVFQLTVAEPHPDVGLDPLELIQKYGYPVESHWVTTEDGYILNMHRIPHGINNAGQSNKPPVLLQHGILCSGADFVNMGPEKALGFLLADLGYDVWLGNARGTTYSRNHTTLNPDEKEFWMFSWHEIGYYDLAAKIDHIIETTGQEKVFYIGHSQGTTSSYVLLSERPEYNDKIRLIVSLAPAAYMSNMKNLIFRVASLVVNDVMTIIEYLEWYELFRFDPVFNNLLTQFCAEDGTYHEMCGTVLFMIAGFNLPQLNYTMIPVIVSNTPAGLSYRQFIHYVQLIDSGYFRQFDHGEMNLEIYGQSTPPNYDLGAVTAPVALFYSDNDWLCDTVDVERLHSELANPVLLLKNRDPNFNHVDYIWANDIVELVNNDVIEIMSKY